MDKTEKTDNSVQKEKNMISLLAVLVFCILMFKIFKLVFKITWSAVSVAACVLAGLALPVLIVCLIFAGGLLLLVPVALIAAAYFILKALS